MLTLRHGQAVVLDVESHAIKEHLLDPPLVSVGLHGLYPLPYWTLFTRQGVMQIVDATLGYEHVGSVSPHAQMVHWNLDEGALEDYLRDLLPHCNLITHRGAYDLGVIVAAFPALLPLIEECCDRGGVYDTRIAAARLAGAQHPEYAGLNAFHPAVRNLDGTGWKDQFADRGKFLNLSDLSAAHGGPVLSKSVWGPRFGELDGVPPQSWPPSAINYCIADLSATGVIQVQQCLERYDNHPDAPVITPGSWGQGLLTLEILRLHLAHCKDVREGRGIALKPETP